MSASIDNSEAELTLTRLMELSADMRGCALLDSEGKILSATGTLDRWREAARGLLAAADEAAEGAGAGATACHISTEDGEAFALRGDELAIVAVTNRFTLASLVLFDMRALLRDLQAEGTVAATGARVGEGGES